MRVFPILLSLIFLSTAAFAQSNGVYGDYLQQVRENDLRLAHEREMQITEKREAERREFEAAAAAKRKEEEEAARHRQAIEEQRRIERAKAEAFWGKVISTLVAVLGTVMAVSFMRILRALRRAPERIIGAMKRMVKTRKFRFVITGYFAWLVTLIVTNSFTFYDVFQFDEYSNDRMTQFAVLPPIIGLVFVKLWQWCMKGTTKPSR